ncbi:CoA pyrophosphatase [uncultured Propionibacterium sp.]|uniref:NUDIX hydrolase n=1 Tax=uncultured Propionibacterium sp. TaxID=218066 RepID=UPI00292DEC32|nr:CoA pyrophosphatase [uncultured Propionibacterium sp.]
MSDEPAAGPAPTPERGCARVPPALGGLTRALADPVTADLLPAGWRARGRGRPSAVLLLLSDGPDPSLVYTERAAGLRNHGGQLSFPGGRAERVDDDAVATALREANEEIGLDADAVHVLGAMPAVSLSVTGFDVVPVVGWWRADAVLAPGDPHEVASIRTWPVSVLADPAGRVSARRAGRTIGPAWRLGELFLWGFTALLTDLLLRIGGWERPWDAGRVVEVPERFSSDRR